MRRSRKKYKKPIKAWDKQRIESERQILKDYGLRNKKEILMSEAILRRFRKMARDSAAKKDKDMEKILINKTMRLGLLKEGTGLDNVLGLNLTSILERRLQTIIFRKGFANSMRQSRQLIVHGHVIINGRKTVYPSYMVSKDEENNIVLNVTVQKKVQPSEQAVKQGVEKNG
jgi:small subunit ribosomal protein S4